MTGRQPDYRLHVMDKSNDGKGIIGAAWKQPNGRISIAINPGCALLYHPDLVVNLFPVDKPARQRTEELSDDIPF